MTVDHHARGGAPVAVLNRMEPWEANLVLNLRLWCEGPSGQSLVWSEYRKALPGTDAEKACRAFDVFLKTLLSKSFRPLVRHDCNCACVGSDESILVNLVGTAADGHLNDAALIATLMTGPAQAEHIALLAGQVGVSLRHIHQKAPPRPTPEDVPAQPRRDIARLH